MAVATDSLTPVECIPPDVKVPTVKQKLTPRFSVNDLDFSSDSITRKDQRFSLRRSCQINLGEVRVEDPRGALF